MLLNAYGKIGMPWNKILHGVGVTQSKGLGFVFFYTLEDANKVVSSFHGYMFNGNPLPVPIAQMNKSVVT